MPIRPGNTPNTPRIFVGTQPVNRVYAGTSMVWEDPNFNAGGQSASFQIARFDGNTNDELVAPVACWFTPTNITGFVGFDGAPISEPTGDTNVYDPTAIEIFWFWDFGDPGYVPLVTPNLPVHMRDVNRAYAKRPCHVFHAPGPKTVTLYGVDSAGNWGSATFTFGPSGQAPVIADPEVVFAGNKTCYYSEAGIFPDPLPASAVTATTTAAVVSYRNARQAAGDTFVRIACRRGETYTNRPNLEGGRFGSVYYGAYGDPLAARPKHVRTNGVSGPFYGRDSGTHIVVDQDWEGGYDAATETGRRAGIFTENGQASNRILLHRSRFSGMTMVDIVKSANAFRAISDCEITNWQDYGVFGGDGSNLTLAIIGSDLYQKTDALSGTHHGVGNSNFANLTNRHGPIRNGSTRDLYITCSSFFSRNGWSQRSGTGAGNTTPGTLAQASYRHGSSGSLTIRNQSAWERCSFEGGAGGVHFVDLGAQEPSTDYQSNVLLDGNLFVASPDTASSISGKGRGMSARNNYFFVPPVAHSLTDGPRHAEQIRWRFDGAVDPDGPSRVFVFNNSTYILANNAQIGSLTSRVTSAPPAAHNPVLENNVVFAPNTSPTLGTDLGTFATPTLAGFTPRYQGVRFNFPPIGHPSMTNAGTVGAVNLNGTNYGTAWYLLAENFRVGGAGPVANGEQISMAYPNYSAVCNGVLGQVTRAMVEGTLPSGGVRYHQISIHNHSVKAAAPEIAGGNGQVEFEFTDSAILVRNLSSVTWTGAFWVLLDLRDRLMGFVPGTANPTTIPLLIPAPGSPAIVPSRTGPWAPRDFSGAARGGAAQPPSGAVAAGPNVQGAIVAAP